MQRSINIYNSTSCIIAQNVESSLSVPCITGFVQLGKNTLLDLLKAWFPSDCNDRSDRRKKRKHRNDNINRNFDRYDFFSQFSAIATLVVVIWKLEILFIIIQ